MAQCEITWHFLNVMTYTFDRILFRSEAVIEKFCTFTGGGESTESLKFN